MAKVIVITNNHMPVRTDSTLSSSFQSDQSTEMRAPQSDATDIDGKQGDCTGAGHATGRDHPGAGKLENL